MPGVLDAAVIDLLLLGEPDRRRQLQDFPILGDVWTEFALDPGARHELLITPYRDVPAGELADYLAEHADGPIDEAAVSYLHGLVAARLTLADLCIDVIPATKWWTDLRERIGERDPQSWSDDLRRHLSLLLHRETLAPSGEVEGPGKRGEDAVLARRAGAERQAAKLGLLIGVLGTAQAQAAGDLTELPFRTLEKLAEGDGGELIVKLGADALDRMMRQSPRPLIFLVSSNRRAEFAVAESVPAIKADAARRLFTISCSDIAWAVLDSGIDADHPAFRSGAPGSPESPSRVVATYDFGKIRRILDRANKFSRAKRAATAGELADEGVGDPQANEQALEAIASKMSGSAPVDWALIEPLVLRPAPRRPTHPHGTHVAGILGGNWTDQVTPVIGVCPDIRLYDFRVLGPDREESEFAVIAALQFIGWLNRRFGRRVIDGVNMSLSIRHNVRNYACGWTPICMEANDLAANGVVVVAAAGNRGFQQFRLADETSFESYAASSITDPGNADHVITVGATHRHWPHTYGVSFFSSRGPTGDGRLKPDLLAPGERIQSAVPHEGVDTFDGTSMAAPHVSGAAALLMARHKELKGRPDRIKQILCETATDLGRERAFQGHGMVDVLRAIQSV